MRVAILLSGGGSNMEALVRSMSGDHPARPVLVASNDPGAGGLARAEAFGVPTAAVDHRDFPDREGFEAILSRRLAEARPDLICLAGFMRILTPEFASRWPMLNIHPSLLPRHKGLNTHARAIAAGDAEAGCTVHEVTAALDDGPILGQAKLPILPGETSDGLASRVLRLEHKLYPAVLGRVARGNRSRLNL